MRIKLSKLATLLLAAVVLAVPACTDYSADLKEVRADISALKAGEIATLQNQVSGLQSAVSTLESTTIPALQNQIKDANSKIAELQDKAKDLQDQINTKADKKDLEAAVKALEEAQGKIAALETRADAAEKAIKDAEDAIKKINEETIPDLQKQINENKADVDAFKEATNKSIDALEKAAEALAATDEDLQKQIDAIVKKLDDYVLTTTFEAKVAELQAAIDTKVAQADYDAQVKAFNEAIAALKGRMDTAEDDIADLQAKLLQEISDREADVIRLENKLTEFQEAYNTFKASVETALDDLNDEVDNLWDAVEDNYTLMMKYYNELKGLIAINAAEIEGLWARVQSVVYVPVTNDGKAAINFVKNNETIIPGLTTITYQVIPEEQAANVVAAFEADPACLDMEVVSVKTRAEAEPDLEIKAVELADATKGYINVTVLAQNMNDLTKDVAVRKGGRYSAALILDANGDNRGTEYVNLVPHYLEVSVAGFRQVDEEGNVQVAFDSKDNDVEIPYTETELQTLFGKTQAVFADAEGNLYSKQNIIDNYGVALDLKYAIKYRNYIQAKFTEKETTKPIAEYDTTYVALPEALIDLIATAPEIDEEFEEMPEVTAQLTEINPDLANTFAIAILGVESDGKTINVFEDEADYISEKCDPSGVAVLTITKIKLELNMNVDPVKWSIANGDVNNYLFDVDPESNYLRSLGCKASPVEADVETLANNNITPASFSHMKPVKVDFKGAKDAKGRETQIDPSCVKIDKDGNVDFCLYYFDWDKTYKMEAVYFFPQADVTLKATINTVDRDREPIIVTYPAKTLTLLADADLFALEDVKDAFWAEASKIEYIAEAFTGENAAADFMDFYFNGNFKGAKVGDYAKTGCGVRPGYTYEDPAGFAVVNWAAFAPTYGQINFVYGPDALGTDTSFVGSKACYGQVARFEKELTLEGPGFDLKHNSFLVDNDGENYFAQAQPMYTPDDGVAISKFDIKKIDLNQAFYFIDEEGVKIEDPAAAGLAAKFDFRVAPEDPNIVIGADNKMYYHGYDRTVKVTAEATITNKNGKTYVTPTSFDEGGVYETFYVKQFNPVKVFTVDSVEVPVDKAKVYEVNVDYNTNMIDQRDWAIINKENGFWTIGDGNNGFANYANAAVIYGFGNYQFRFFCDEPEIADKFSSVPGQPWIVRFDNTQEISLVKPVVVNFYVSVDSPWDKPVDLEDASTVEELDALLEIGLVAKGTITLIPVK